MIKEMPLYERPREKLINNGVSSLSNIELLAIIIKNGTRGKSAVELSSEILYSINSLSDLKDIELLEIVKIKGIGKVKAMEILCAIELGKRILNHSEEKMIFNNAKTVFTYLKHRLDYPQEHFVVMYLNQKCCLLTLKELFVGSKSQVLASPNEIFKYAIKIGAVSIILSHNHPSGDSTPSNADIKITKEITDIGKSMNILVLDHIIIGDEYYSFNEHNIL